MRVLIPVEEVLRAVCLCVHRERQALAEIGSRGWWEGNPCKFIGALTPAVAVELGQPQQRVRNRLRMMQRHGLVISHRSNLGSTIRWYPAPTPCKHKV